MILSRIYRLHSHHHNQIVVDSPGSPDCSCLHLVVGRQRVTKEISISREILQFLLLHAKVR